jgi:hypothetical protein
MGSRCLLATVVALGAMLALPNVAGAQVPTGDSVVGSGTIRESLININVSSGPSGENPRGEASATIGGFFGFLSASVDCLAVSGSVGTFAGAIGLSSFDDTHYKFTVEDNGPTGSPPDRVVSATATTPFDCTEPLDFGSFSTLVGDMVVVDAPALPTSKQQCKNGGWRNFPGFKNQGDCVSFVATGGKNPPAGP